MRSQLSERDCKEMKAGTPPLTELQAHELLKETPGWRIENGELVRLCSFENYYKTMAFVNAVAWVAHSENHHPDLEVGYNKCKIRFSTHSVGGLSENDFISAAKVNELIG